MKPQSPFSLPVIFLLGVFLISGLSGCTTTTQTATQAAMQAATETLAAVAIASPQTLTFNFDGLSDSLPTNWQVLYAPFDAGSQIPEIVKAQAQENHFMIENLGTFSGLYALYTGKISSANLQISLDTLPDGANPMGVFLVCRYSSAGWYQFRVSNGSSSVQYVQPQGKTFNATILTEGPGVFLDDGKHRLTGICDQNRLTLQVDGREILTKDADFLSTGSFGFGVEAFDQPGGRKAFDNVEVNFLSVDTASAPTLPPERVAVLEPATLTPAPVSTSTPTLIPAPAATLRPTVIPEGELTLYQTEFDDGDQTLTDWKTFAYSMDKKDFVSDGFKTWTAGGVYRFEQEANTRVFVIYDKDLGTADVDISMSGNPPFEGHGGLGLVCRYSQAGWYQFMVESSGGWSIRLVKPDENGQFHFHIISSAPPVKHLEGKANLRAECKGDRLTFYINGEKMASLHDSTFRTGQVGFLGWAFAIGDDWNTVDKFSARRAQWSETNLPGPAPTPGTDGVIYNTDFVKLDDLNPYWAKIDWGVIGIPGSPILIGGPGGQVAPHTYLYINDFDPATDVEISADIRPAYIFRRGLICRYSEDGWYEAYYLKDGKENPIVLLRKQRDEQGKFTGADTILGSALAGSLNSINLTLTCAGNQISVKLNGEQVIYAEDDTWTSGRYGFLFMDNPPGNLRNTLLNYTVRPVQTGKIGEVIFDTVFDAPEKIASMFNLDLMNDGRLQIQDNALLLKPGNNPLHPFTNDKFADVELLLEAEFLSSSTLNLHCRNESKSMIGAEINRDGGWNLVLDHEKILANGSSSAIQSGKNQIMLGCVGPKVTFKINGKTLVNLELPNYSTTQGAVGWDVYEGSDVKITKVALTAFQSQMPPPVLSPLLNQVILSPVYQPGETIFAWDSYALLYRPGWWGKENRPWNWTFGFDGAHPPQQSENAILVTSIEKVLTYFAYRPDLYDLPIEISANATLTSKGGAVALFCRATANGRYEFYIQHDGKWYIRRNRLAEHYLPQAKHLTTLANGTLENFSPEKMQLNATCNGPDLIFTLNGVELGRVQDSLYPEGQAGIFFDVFSEGSFTNLFIKRAK